jgi:hypothetical protein
MEIQKFSRPFYVLVLLSVILFLGGCASSNTLNDFFGIQMDKNEANKFKIVSYSDRDGANYYSNANMNPNIFAYAEIDVKMIRLKVVNMSSNEVTYNYNLDQFKLYTREGEEFILLKEDRIKYPGKGFITQNNSVQFNLELPSDFTSRVGLDKQNKADAIYTYDIWKGDGSLRFVKENIDRIEVELGGKFTIILKVIPETS